MKFWTKDLLLVPSSIFTALVGYNLAGLLSYQDQLSAGSVLTLKLLLSLALVSIACNIHLAVKLIKEQVKG